MIAALYQMGMYEGWTYQELVGSFPSPNTAVLACASNYYWASQFTDTYHLANLNNWNLPTTSPISSCAASPEEEPGAWESEKFQPSIILCSYIEWCILSGTEKLIFTTFTMMPADNKEKWALVYYKPSYYQDLEDDIVTTDHFQVATEEGWEEDVKLNYGEAPPPPEANNEWTDGPAHSWDDIIDELNEVPECAPAPSPASPVSSESWDNHVLGYEFISDHIPSFIGLADDLYPALSKTAILPWDLWKNSGLLMTAHWAS
ncbi:hypothetical protein FRC11_009261 [Ceratobasidium sp. 423]|nr:hypothetical protein FRC11_009261 [Ceratobasidium sp. 423]